MLARVCAVAAIGVVVISAASCKSQTPSMENWVDDVRQLKEKLPELHVAPYWKTSESDFQDAGTKLEADAAHLSEQEIVRRMTELVRSIGDSHTLITPPLDQLHTLPVQFYIFADGVRVITASEEFRHAIGAKVVSLDEVPIANVLTRLSGILPYDNESSLMHLQGRHLAITETLQIADAWPQQGAGRISLSKDDENFSISCEAVDMKVARTIKWIPGAPIALYAQKPQLSCWNDWLPDSKTVYFKYNRCSDKEAFEKLVGQTERFIQTHDVERFVVDLRDNTGGDSRIFEPLLHYLANNEKLNERGRLFVVIGRATYSSAVLNALQLKEKTNAVFVGEPTGGKPNHFGELKSFTLKNSKLMVFYSTKHFQSPRYRGMSSLVPDLRTKLTYELWSQGIDPAMKAIESFTKNDAG